MGKYRAVSKPTATVGFMAGARIWSVDNDIDPAYRLAARRSPPSAAAMEAPGWTLRWDHIDPSWFVPDGGWLAASDVTWDLFGGVGYRWNEWLSLVAGYRAMGVDYEDDGFVCDVVQQGPLLGAVLRF